MRICNHKDYRERTFFAWLPFRTSDGHLRWLSSITVIERFDECLDCFGDGWSGWVKIYSARTHR